MICSEEFIGRTIEVIEARNKALFGLRGQIIDETRNTLKILTKTNEEKTLLKQGTLLNFGADNLLGDTILCKPEDRIKIRN
ncbi:MAG: ribonuclease P protein subunit [Nanoarchaeota archaeon]|nr:ribonuclease P protein subunit [Nanoarchaeota archaeon]MBU1321358.1 ribonuclease P protein subunit [Nanoarchaeota archaeon]MBU1597350.1 ribonuclease P protein subunit [Nanoarchaeota archaeon]MBU2441265.1 ribonuclease P protein subunit [Nanoarchaeota archaeon]